MKRRTFIWISIATTSTVFFPVMNCSSELNYNELLADPISLSKIIISEMIDKIGEYYLKLVPSEAKKNVLISLLIGNLDNEYLAKSRDRLLIQNSLKQKTKQDFITNNIILIDGWVLSRTEARQCALYSLIHN